MKERRYNLSVKRFLAWVIAIAVAVSILTVPQTESYAAGGKIKTIAVTNLPAKQLTLKKGKSFTLKTKVTATGKISKKVAYKSSNKKVATVNAKGKITAKKKGTATITVYSKADKKKTCKIKVNGRQMDDLVFTDNTMYYEIPAAPYQRFTLEFSCNFYVKGAREHRGEENLAMVVKVVDQ